MTLGRTARLVIEATAKSEGVPSARIVEGLAAFEGNSPAQSAQPVRLLTQKEFAGQWGCTVRTVQRWIDEGTIKAIKRGRLVRIPEDQLWK